MKELWIEITQTASPSEKESLLKLAAESGLTLLEGAKVHNYSSKCDISVLHRFDENEFTKLKREDKKVALRITIKGKEDENTAVKAAELTADYIILNCLDWRVIPLENLIAKTRGKSKLIAEVSNAEDARLVLKTLELGTDGVLLQASDPDELVKTIDVVKQQALKIELVPAKVTAVKQIGTGARVCVDTCDLMGA